MNVCGACGLDFASLESFDAHRFGKHSHDYSPEHPDGRRCLTMTEIAWHFSQDARGRWILTERMGRARKAFSHRAAA
jgi:hypothetical protein